MGSLMPLSALIGRRVYLDANIYIYAFELVEAKQEACSALFNYLDHDANRLIGSELLIPELLSKPMELNNQDLVDSYWDFLESEDLDLLPLSKDMHLQAAELRAKYKLKAVDALHLATAIIMNCSAFVSDDAKLKRVTEIAVINLEQIAQSLE